MPGEHSNDNDAVRLKRIAEIRKLIAEIAVEPPAQECCAEQDNGHERDPAADGVHDHRTGEVVKLFAEARLDPGLHAELLVPGDAFEERDKRSPR